MLYEREVPTESAVNEIGPVSGASGQRGRSHASSDTRPQDVAEDLRRWLESAQARDSLSASFDTSPRPLPAHAKLDHSGVVILGLFSSLHHNAPAPDGRVEFRWTHADGDDELTVSCGSLLGDSDQRVFRGLVAHATDEYATLAADRLYERSPPYDPTLKVRVRCTLERLARVAGFGSPGAGPTNTVIRKSLARLCDVKLTWRKASGSGEPREEMLITSDGSVKGHGSVSVGFHSRLQAAILASRQGEQYLRIGMDESRALHGACARLLHHRLTHMNEGASTLHGVHTLEGYLWRDDALTRYAARNRKAKLINAMFELRSVGWRFEVAQDHPGCLWVTRPTANAFRSTDTSSAPACGERVSKQ